MVTGTASSYASGATWVVCSSVATGDVCNGGVGYNNAATTKSHLVTNRLVIKASSTTAISIASDSSGYKWTWNNDFLLASMYHPAGTTVLTDGTQWCSSFSNELSTTAYKAVNLTASKGLTGRSKCTWLIETTDKNSGPMIQMKQADYLNFLFHWVEWINIGAF